MTADRIGTGRWGVPPGDPLATRLFPPLTGTVRWGLDRMERLLSSVGSPQKAFPVLHVAGTNGKGTVARTWASILQAAGFRTGLYTSPQLRFFRERILVDGVPVPDDSLQEMAEQLRPAIVRTQPSFFEATTALGFLALARAGVEIAVLEVGLGGRLDATNVVDPVLTVITGVGLEHRDLLGDTLEEIAREKAGIFKPGIPAYTVARDPDVVRILTEEAASLGIPLTHIRPPEGRWDLGGARFGLRTRRWGRLEIESPLVGEHQMANVALAVRSLEALPPRFLPTRAAILEGVRRVRVPGRVQVVTDPPRQWILDVAHNPEAMAALGRVLDRAAPPEPRVAVVGILADKDWGEMVPEVASRVDLCLLCVPDSAPPERRWDLAEVQARFPDLQLLPVPDPGQALLRAEEFTGSGGTVVVTGSFFTVGSAFDFMEGRGLDALSLDLRTG
ncbi:MAG: bifunctional folylpolyglutamate synthase/dihydrofolate synthase [Gemmatimonadales bacterium]|nr:MAG: bifunctional folylpolyglutamate synthase/dihydrofolate synthase [Gemmatimonadales bacterium]